MSTANGHILVIVFSCKSNIRVLVEFLLLTDWESLCCHLEMLTGSVSNIIIFCSSQTPVLNFMFPHRFSMMSCPLCAYGCPCMCLTTVAFTTASSCSRSWSLSSSRLQLQPPPPPLLVCSSTGPAQSPAAVPTLTATPRLMGSCQEQRQQLRRRGSSASPQSFSFSARRWSCAQIWSSPSLDMRHSGVTGEPKEVNITQDICHFAVTYNEINAQNNLQRSKYHK